jgi:hypothetical protein
MDSKVPAIGVVLECAVAMAGMTSPTAVTEASAIQAWASAPRPSDHEAEFSYKGLTVNIAGESDGGSGSGSGSGSDPADDEDFDAGYGACYTYAFENEGFCVKDNACHACAASCADECSSSSSFNVVHVHVHPSAAFDMEVLGEG